MLQTMHQLLTFFDSVEKVEGRKKLQKMIHLLNNAEQNFPFKYQYYHYGPFSSTLQYEVNRLVEEDYVKETQVNGAYVYAITEKGRKFKELLEREGKFHFNFDRDLLQSMSHEESQFLEVVSTYAFLIESGDSFEQAKSRTAQLKSHLSGYLENAIQFYNTYIVKD